MISLEIFHSPAHASRRALTLIVLCGLLPACATRTPQEAPPAPVEPLPTQIESHAFRLQGEDSVIGQLAKVPLRDGDTLLDVARHFGLGYRQIAEANPDLDPWVPPPGARVVLPLQFIMPDAPRKGVVVNLAAMRLFHFDDNKHPSLTSWPVGIGREGRSTPIGQMRVDRKMEHPIWYATESIRREHAKQGDPLPAAVSPGPDNPLGDYALYLSKPMYLIHGTNKPYSIGFRASNGCIRLYPEDIDRLFREVPKNTPVSIVNQPYLLGWRGGELYLEAHAPFEETDGAQAKKKLLAKLRQIEKKQGLKLDWPKIEEVLTQARGIPIPVVERSPSLNALLDAAVALDRPAQLFGQPDAPAPAETGWSIRTQETRDEFTARKLATMLNHLGPRIPARAMAKDGHYRVVAGPFADAKAAKAAARTLQTDFEFHTELIEPGATQRPELHALHSQDSK